MSLWLLTTATGQGFAGFIISQTKDIPNSTYYYGLGAVTVAVAVVLFAVAPWTKRQMADVDALSQEQPNSTAHIASAVGLTPPSQARWRST